MIRIEPRRRLFKTILLSRSIWKETARRRHFVLRPSLDRYERRAFHQYFFVESVASYAEVLIELTGGQPDDRFLNERFHAPAVAHPHAFRAPHRYGFVHRVADMARENIFQRFVSYTANRSLRFGAAGINIAIGFYRNF